MFEPSIDERVKTLLSETLKSRHNVTTLAGGASSRPASRLVRRHLFGS